MGHSIAWDPSHCEANHLKVPQHFPEFQTGWCTSIKWSERINYTSFVRRWWYRQHTRGMYRLQTKKELFALVAYSLASVEHGERSGGIRFSWTSCNWPFGSASTGHFNATCQSKKFAAVCSICHNLLSKCVSVTQFAHFLFFPLVCQRRADKIVSD